MPNRTPTSLQPVRIVVAVAVGFALAWLGGLVLGEYPFNGILPILGGAGLGMAIAWVVTKAFGGAPPVWMALVAAGLAGFGEIRAVEEDASGADWTTEGWIAIVVAVAVAGYNVFTASRRASGTQRA